MILRTSAFGICDGSLKGVYIYIALVVILLGGFRWAFFLCQMLGSWKRRLMGSSLLQTNMAVWKVMIFNRKYIHLQIEKWSIFHSNLSLLECCKCFIFLGAKSYPRFSFFCWGLYAMAQGVNSAMVLASGYSSQKDGTSKWMAMRKHTRFSTDDLFFLPNFGPVFLLFFDLIFVFVTIQGRNKQKLWNHIVQL